MNLYFKRNYSIFIQEPQLINNHKNNKAMLLFETTDRLSRMHQMIKREATGSPDEFAGKFNIKRRQLYNILEEFKDYGAEIKYSRIKNSFYYENEFDVFVNISITPLSGSDNLGVVAGCHGIYKPFLIKYLGRFFNDAN